MCGWCRSSQIDGANGQTLLLDNSRGCWLRVDGGSLDVNHYKEAAEAADPRMMDFR